MIRSIASLGWGWSQCNAKARVPCVVGTSTHCVGAGGTGLVAHAMGGAGCTCVSNLDLMPKEPAVALFVPCVFNCAPVGQSRAHCHRCWGQWSSRWCRAAGGVGHHVGAWLGGGCAWLEGNMRTIAACMSLGACACCALNATRLLIALFFWI